MKSHVDALISHKAIALAITLTTLLLNPQQQAYAAATSIADQPLFVTNNVPPNMMLALSVEWPTGVVAAYKGASDYSAANRYLGYFDPEHCYTYYKSTGGTSYNTPDAPGGGTPTRNAAAAATEFFVGTTAGSGTNSRECGGSEFSGNFLNWAAMHAIDTFRFAMTGGDRVIDTTSLTVVEKARHTGIGGYGQFPKKTLSGASAIAKLSPFSGWSNIYVRVTNNSTELDPFSDNATRGRIIQVSNDSAFGTGGSKLTYTYLARVKVCSTTAPGLEYNGATDYQICQQYPNSGSPIYKPVGLIQKNADKMRFGASGYLLDNAASRAGGVLRARMKSVGPKILIPKGTPPDNPNKEWDAATGVYVINPDTTDATVSSAASGTTIDNSGVVNYLNKFGKANGYKSNDTFSELYYAAQRALRNLAPVPEYVSSMTAAMYDGFPVITTAVTEPTGPSFSTSDLSPLPIQYSCQQHNIVGIADSNCWNDVFVPGNTLAGPAGHPTGGPTDPAVAPNAIDVTALGNTLGTLEGFSPAVTTLGATYANSGRKNTYHIASLAYWANTKDILTDVTSQPWTIGKQQTKSYFVDVREGGSNGPANNQMWLAAKYGGFDDLNKDGVPATVSTWHTNTDTLAVNSGTLTSASDNGKRPDNYFTGDAPDKLISSLSSIFNNVLARSLSGAGASISTVNFQSTTNAGAYTVEYNSKDWTGDVKGNQITVDAAGTPVTTNMWSAQDKLDLQVDNGGGKNGWSTQRKIVTYKTGASPVGVPFALANLSATQQTYLGTSTAAQQDMLDYLRGRQCHEVGNTFTSGCTDTPAHKGLFRKRNHILGDIVSSEATVVPPPDAPYSARPGYAAFKIAYAARKRMAYVGSNDGMLHAFDADVGAPAVVGPPALAAVALGATAGKELWAYIPSFVLSGPSSPATATVDGLAARTAATSFVHRYYVDQTPFDRDVDFCDTKGATCGVGSPYDWRTIIFGGLNRGGRGYYAIDVTNPADWTDETAVAGKVLWEFSDEDMGFTFGRPVIVRTERDGWVVIVASGYNNTLGSVTANQGKGFLYILNAKTGALIEKISTGVGTATTPSGFAHPAAFIPDTTTFFTDYVYGGDLEGNLWRFDLRGTPGTYLDPTKLVNFSAGGSPQPITVEPKIEIGANGVARWIFIGTGKLLHKDDLADTQLQTFYAIRDGSRSQAFGTGSGQSALFGGLSHPISKSKLVAVTNLVAGYLPDTSKPMGWYYDLHASEKITTPIDANEGLISWNGYVPTDDPCAPGAASNLYVAEYDTGKSRLTDVSGNPIQFYASLTYLIKIQFVKDVTGKIRAVITTGDPTGGHQIEKAQGKFGRASGTPVRVNWREILD